MSDNGGPGSALGGERSSRPPESPVGTKPVRVLLVEDSAEDAALIQRTLTSAGIQVGPKVVRTAKQVTEHLRAEPYDLVLSAYSLPGWTGVDVLDLLRQEGHDLPLALVTDELGDELAVDCVRRGVAAYILKGRLDNLPDALRRALDESTAARTRSRVDRLLQVTDAVMYVLDAEGPPFPPVWVSENVSRVLGYDPAEVLSPSWWISHLHPDELDRVVAKLSNFDEWDTLFRSEYRLRRKDGTYLWIQDQLKMVRDESGLPKELLGVWLDVTGRHEDDAQRALASAVSEQAADAILVVDGEGIVQYANGAFERRSGYGRAEIVGQDRRILESGEEDDAVDRAMWDALARGETWTGDVVNKAKDGSLYEERKTSFPVSDPAGETTSYVIMSHDTTHERTLEAKLRQAQKMEAVGRLAGGVAHDFNNSLTVISVTTELLLANTEIPQDVRTDIQEIRKATKRAETLTRQLLAFSRRQVLEPRLLDLNDVVGDIEKMLPRLIGEDIDVRAVLDPRLGTVRADGSQIEQVIMNLAVNARDAMPEGGRLTIETANVELDAAFASVHVGARPGDHVLLAVTDTGLGMDADTLVQAFEPFFTTKGAGQGTGLGLATVYGIIKQSEGYVQIYSEPGQGTAVKIYLPRLDAVPEAHVTNGDGASAPRGSATILLAEDEEGVRRLVVRILESSGYRVLSATSGDEALGVAADHDGAIDLLITDVVMPGMSGRELSEYLSAAAADLKTLYISGYPGEAIAHQELLDVGVAFLQKPFTPEGLVHKVHEVLAPT